MKKTLTILLLIVASVCKGQDNGIGDREILLTHTKDFDSVITSVYSKSSITNLSYNWELKHIKDFDTINVILICIDTKEKEIGPTFFVKAIKINKFVAGGWNIGDYYSPAHWEHFCYLTKDMKPFKFTVIQCLNN